LSSRNSIGHVIRLKIPQLNPIFENENTTTHLFVCIWIFPDSNCWGKSGRTNRKKPDSPRWVLKNSFFIYFYMSHLLYNSFAFGHIIIAAGVFTRRKPPPVDRDRPLPQQRREFTVNQDFWLNCYNSRRVQRIYKRSAFFFLNWLPNRKLLANDDQKAYSHYIHQRFESIIIVNRIDYLT
jgi:hypothetical protein